MDLPTMVAKFTNKLSLRYNSITIGMEVSVLLEITYLC